MPVPTFGGLEAPGHPFGFAAHAFHSIRLQEGKAGLVTRFPRGTWIGRGQGKGTGTRCHTPDKEQTVADSMRGDNW